MLNSAAKAPYERLWETNLIWMELFQTTIVHLAPLSKDTYKQDTHIL